MDVPPSVEPSRPPGRDRLAVLERAVVVVLFAALTVIGCVQIANRHGLKLPVSNLEQLLPHLFIAMTFLGMSLMYRYRAHLSVEIVPDSLSPPARRRFRLVLWSVTMVFLVALIVTSVDVMLFQIEIRAVTNMGYPSALLTATLPIGAAASLWRIWRIEIAPLLRGGAP